MEERVAVVADPRTLGKSLKGRVVGILKGSKSFFN
jgi:hypothetical protein